MYIVNCYLTEYIFFKRKQNLYRFCIYGYLNFTILALRGCVLIFQIKKIFKYRVFKIIKLAILYISTVTYSIDPINMNDLISHKNEQHSVREFG